MGEIIILIIIATFLEPPRGESLGTLVHKGQGIGYMG